MDKILGAKPKWPGASNQSLFRSQNKFRKFFSKDVLPDQV